MAMSLVSTTTVGAGGAASIEYTNIAQTGKDLLLLVSGGSTSTGSFRVLRLEINANTGTNYSSRDLQGDGTTPGSTSQTSATYIDAGYVTATGSFANSFGSSAIYFTNYAGSASKSISSDSVSEANTTTQGQRIVAGLWNQTSAITSIRIFLSAGNWTQNSTASLYIIS
jgi:hypothetical protein